jgi:DNA-binding protein H-NS
MSKIKIDSKIMTEMIIDLRERGEDPNNYFEVVEKTETTLVEGQTTLSEFTEPEKKSKIIRRKSEPKKRAHPTKGKKKMSYVQRFDKFKNVNEARLATLPEGIKTFEEAMAAANGDRPAAAAILHELSNCKETWLTDVSRTPSGSVVNYVERYINNVVRKKKSAKPKKGKKSRPYVKFTSKERLDALPEGEVTFRAHVERSDSPEEAAYTLSRVSRNPAHWLRRTTNRGDGRLVRHCIRWLENTSYERGVVEKNPQEKDLGVPWTQDEVDWMSRNYANLRSAGMSINAIAELLRSKVGNDFSRTEKEISNMVENLGL